MNIYEPILVQKRPILIDENRKRSIFWPKIALFMPKNELLWSINCEYNHFFKNHKNHHTLFLTYPSKTNILVKWNLKIHLMALLSDENILYPWLRWQVNRLELISSRQTSCSCYLKWLTSLSDDKMTRQQMAVKLPCKLDFSFLPFLRD